MVEGEIRYFYYNNYADPFQTLRRTFLAAGAKQRRRTAEATAANGCFGASATLQVRERQSMFKSTLSIPDEMLLLDIVWHITIRESLLIDIPDLLPSLELLLRLLFSKYLVHSGLQIDLHRGICPRVVASVDPVTEVDREEERDTVS